MPLLKILKDRIDFQGRDIENAGAVQADEVDGEVNAQTESITELRDVYIIDAGTFDPANYPDDALIAERDE